MRFDTSDSVSRFDISLLSETAVSATFALPMMIRFADQSIICVRIPARIAGIPKNVCRIPVISPQRTPASVAIAIAAHAFTPETSRTAHTAAPVQMVPSTVRSAMSRILNVIKTPIAMMPQIIP